MKREYLVKAEDDLVEFAETGEKFQMKIADRVVAVAIYRRDVDSDKVALRAKINILRPIQLDFTLFKPKEGKKPFGRFPGKLRSSNGRSPLYWHDTPLIDPETGRVSSTYTTRIEQEIAKTLTELLTSEEEEPAKEVTLGEVSGVALNALQQAEESISEDSTPVQEEEVREDTEEKIDLPF